MLKLIYPKFWYSRNIIAYILWPLSQIYHLCGIIRKMLAKPFRFNAKVICVGNITVGGTGKTQVVIWLAELLKSYNLNFVIISKAYASNLKSPMIVNIHHQAMEVGDESVLLRNYGTVIAAPKVDKNLLSLVQSIKPDIIIFDDNMQNPNFYRDFTIVTIDSDRQFGNRFLFPAGPLREYIYNIHHNNVDIIVSIGTNHNKNIQGINFKIPSFSAITKPCEELDKTKVYYPFCGIGNPDKFFSTLKKYGLNFNEYKIFPDHHFYSQKDLAELNSKARTISALLITTKKDYVKIERKDNIICFEVELSIDNAQDLIKIINEKFLQKI